MKLSDVFTPAELASALKLWGSGDHHPLGPSSLWRVNACNASALGSLACATADTSNEHAERGTRIHKTIEMFISKGIEPDCDTDEAQHLERAKAALGKAPRLWDAEVRLSMDALYFGTADAVKIRGDVAFVIDWKTGAMAELADESHRYQLGHLAFALMFERQDIEVVHAKAVYTETGTESETYAFARADLADYMAKIAALSASCRSPDAEFAHATGDNCKYCKVMSAGRCPTFAVEALESAKALGVTIPETETALTVDKADDLLLKCKTVAKALERIEEQAKEAIKAAGGSEHFMVINVSGRKTTDWKALCLAKGITAQEIELFTKTGENVQSVREKTKK